MGNAPCETLKMKVLLAFLGRLNILLLLVVLVLLLLRNVSKSILATTALPESAPSKELLSLIFLTFSYPEELSTTITSTQTALTLLLLVQLNLEEDLLIRLVVVLIRRGFLLRLLGVIGSVVGRGLLIL